MLGVLFLVDDCCMLYQVISAQVSLIQAVAMLQEVVKNVAGRWY